MRYDSIKSSANERKWSFLRIHASMTLVLSLHVNVNTKQKEIQSAKNAKDAKKTKIFKCFILNDSEG